MASEPCRRRGRAGGGPAVFLALAAASAVVTFTPAAHAYCYTTTCKEVFACDGEPPPDDCKILGWASRCMGYSVQEDGGADIGGRTLEQIVDLAFDAWRFAECGDGPPGFVAQNLGRIPCDKTQYNKDAGNANVIVIRAGRWPHAESGHNIALTTTTFDPDTGDLLDADIELNADGYGFTVSDEAIDYDLLSVLTHEVGHFLGMGHTEDPEATMFPVYDGGTAELRSLEPDDIAGICALYPPDDAPKETCNPLPKHGFSPYCRDDQPEGDCSANGRGAGAGTSALLVALALGAGSLGRRRRRGAFSARG